MYEIDILNESLLHVLVHSTVLGKALEKAKMNPVQADSFFLTLQIKAIKLQPKKLFLNHI